MRWVSTKSIASAGVWSAERFSVPGRRHVVQAPAAPDRPHSRPMVSSVIVAIGPAENRADRHVGRRSVGFACSGQRAQVTMFVCAASGDRVFQGRSRHSALSLNASVDCWRMVVNARLRLTADDVGERRQTPRPDLGRLPGRGSGVRRNLTFVDGRARWRFSDSATLPRPTTAPAGGELVLSTHQRHPSYSIRRPKAAGHICVEGDECHLSRWNNRIAESP